MIRALDFDPGTKKNIVLRKVITHVIAKNPVEHVWTLNFLKNFKLILPS